VTCPVPKPTEPHETRPAAGRVFVALAAVVAAMAVGLVSLFAVPAASASPLVVARNAVGVIVQPAGQRVGVHEPILAGQGRIRAPGYDQMVVGSCVAPETEAETTAGSLSGRVRMGDYGDEVIRDAGRIPQEPGYFDVIAHGTPTSVIDESGNELDAGQLADRITSTPSWQGQNVRLLSCSTGALCDGIASQLADQLGVDVMAPTTDFTPTSRGNIIWDEGGGWTTFPGDG
jgi:hypothetical protein